MTPLEKTKILTDAMGWEFNLSSVEKYKARCIKKGFKARLKYVSAAWGILKTESEMAKMDKPQPTIEEVLKPVTDKMVKHFVADGEAYAGKNAVPLSPVKPKPAKKKARGRPKKVK